MLTDSKPSKPDPYKDQITVWLEEAPYSAARIWEKIQEQGFKGGYSVVKHFVRGKKEQLNEQAKVRFETNFILDSLDSGIYSLTACGSNV